MQPLTHTEREAAILLGFLKATKSMVNKAMLDIHVGEQGAVCRPQTSHTAKLFNIHLVELISPPSRMVGDHKSYISAVQSVTLNPNFNSANSIGMLCQAIDKFQLWLQKDRIFKKIWLPDLDKELDIKISCDKYLRICGDISKHKFLRLNKTAEKLQVVINNSGGDITLSDAYRTMDYFYEWFHQDFFHLHLTVIAQMINDVAWAIYFYLSPEFTRSYTRDEKKSEKMNAEIYFYTYPADVTTDLGRHFYWDLMNEIRAKPYVQPFVTATYFKEDPDRIITAEND